MKRQPNLFDGFLFEDFANGKAPSKGAKEKIMADGGMESVANALQKLADRIDDMMDTGNRSRRRKHDPDDEDAPESAAPARRGRRDPLEIQGVLFQLNVPVGRRGETMPAYILLPPVRDERELEKLADEVEREFRTAKVYTPKPQFDRNGGNGYHGGSGNSGGGSNYYRNDRWDRDRDYRR